MVVVLTFDCMQVVVAGEELGFSLADIVNIHLVVAAAAKLLSLRNLKVNLIPEELYVLVVCMDSKDMTWKKHWSWQADKSLVDNQTEQNSEDIPLRRRSASVLHSNCCSWTAARWDESVQQTIQDTHCCDDSELARVERNPCCSREIHCLVADSGRDIDDRQKLASFQQFLA